MRVVLAPQQCVRVDRYRLADRDAAQVVFGRPGEMGLLAGRGVLATVSSNGSRPKLGPRVSMLSPNAAASPA
jgi:hypothetical protein